MRLINADALLEVLKDSHFPGAPYVDAGISIAIGKVCDAPTIEPDPDTVSRQAVYDTLTEYYQHRTETQHKALREALDRVPSSPWRKERKVDDSAD